MREPCQEPLKAAEFVCQVFSSCGYLFLFLFPGTRSVDGAGLELILKGRSRSISQYLEATSLREKTGGGGSVPIRHIDSGGLEGGLSQINVLSGWF